MLVLLAVALAWDSVFASLALGSLRLSLRDRLGIALMFGGCDAAALLLGAAVSQPVAQAAGPWTTVIAPLFLGGYGLYVIVLAERCREESDRDTGARWLLWGVPVSLSLDNFVAGLSVGLDQLPIFAAGLIIGAASGVLSLAALLAGSTVRRFAPRRAESIGGVWLVIVAVALALGFER